MENEVIIVATDYGIDEKQSIALTSNLPQILSEREVLIPQFDEVIKMDIDDPESSKRAKEVRLLIQKNRTQGINVWHKTTKDYFLKGGQFVDAIKRKESAINERMESDLMAIEKHAELLEKKRLAELQKSRVAMLSAYVDGANERDLAGMEVDVWKAYFEAKKKEFEDKVAAAKKAEEERIAKEKAEAEERERIRIENAKLKKEAEERERLAKIEADKRAKIEAERLAKEIAERKAREDEEKRKEAEFQAKLKAEREERERLAKEIADKKEAERLEAERLENERKAREKAPDKQKLIAFIESISIELPVMKTKDADLIARDINSKFAGFKKWALTEINKL